MKPGDPIRLDEGLSMRRSSTLPPEINPAYSARTVDPPDPESLFRALVEGDRTALGRAITLVESRAPADRPAALELLDRCYAAGLSGTALSGRGSVRIGISGAPGVGKSTFIDAFGVRLIEAGHRVAVLAVDPSSQRSGGSILGDKTRMARLFARPEAFIRPSPSSGALGGVGRYTRPAIVLCEAAGYDRILVETVGVGQSEIAVRHMVDTFVLLAQAGAGDELQGIKRGIVEVADLIVVTKADGALLEAAKAARSALRAALTLWPADDSGWRAPVHACSAVTGSGFDRFEAEVGRHREHLVAHGAWNRTRSAQALRWMHEELTGRMADRLEGDADLAAAVRGFEERVRSGAISPHRAADRLAEALWPTDPGTRVGDR